MLMPGAHRPNARLLVENPTSTVCEPQKDNSVGTFKLFHDVENVADLQELVVCQFRINLRSCPDADGTSILRAVSPKRGTLKYNRSTGEPAAHCKLARVAQRQKVWQPASA
eukprot:CAMPEP_0115417748 /NCGR_PEP_ID=MMETSP0271-20121206/24291_1 /TAXON_ID=71861 /ORGANISM="Scrippsiella trochoidea, Strain CCMP3099" /LENGTH=110 /DNA_ID=CAMNT_0002842159 /DNA_START=280 /DNA_END=608 /DNA_ORIENTATION=-